ncbi:MAG: phosphohistidine phosphatase SixA [Acidobacteriia bacterium]|nr:phosphohistidine phosphatase SixA [Terriglobia bacterium]
MTTKESDEGRTERPANYEFYIMRHGIAVMRGATAFIDDTKRPLTPEGKQKMRNIASGLVRMGFDLDWIVSSPLVRAVETAEIVGEVLSLKPPLDFCDALRPGGSGEALIAFLAKRPKCRRVLVVGHEPDLGELAARLIGAGRNANMPFKKGGCCLIAFNEFPPKSPGRLVWWLTPRIMRKLA